MSNKYENPPFPKGSTWFNGSTADSSDAANYEGQEYEFTDNRFGTGMTTRVRVVRNIATISLASARLVNLATTGFTNGLYGTRVDGYANATAQRAFPLDDELTQPLAVNDLGYIIIGGPTLVTTGLGADAGNVINVGSKIVAITAAASTSTTAGRAVVADFTGATLLLANQVMHNFSAMSAATTANTGSSILAYIPKW